MTSFVTDKARWSEDSDGFWVSFKTSNRAAALSLTGLEVPHEVVVKRKGKARTREANSYLWILLDKLSEKLSKDGTPVTKVDIYKRLIRDVGGVSEAVCVQDKAVEKLRSGWEHNGLGWVTDTMPAKIEGCTVVILYYGSSTYDTEQMRRLINLVVQECKQQGIETMTPMELERLKGYG